jgi:hypothetical protein
MLTNHITAGALLMSWSVPSNAAIRTIAKFVRAAGRVASQPSSSTHPLEGVVDLGSGNGYWGYLLHKLGIKVTCVDNHSDGEDTGATDGGLYYPTIKQDIDSFMTSGGAQNHSTLFFSWPRSLRTTVAAIEVTLRSSLPIVLV